MKRLTLLCILAAVTAHGCRHTSTRPEPGEQERLVPTGAKLTKTIADTAAVPSASNPRLPPPRTDGGLTVAQAIAQRRSQRSFASSPLTFAELGQLAWAAQGITEPNDELRSAPSAGALYPLELYFVIRDGLFHYQPQSHSLELKQREDLRERIAKAALDQVPLRVAPCTVVITAVTLRTARKYDARASRYIAMEAGHAAQNLLLEATSRGLVGVPVGAFDDARLASLLALPDGEVPLYLIAVGNHP